MRFKLDENLHPDAVVLLRREGHDALSVWDEGLRGAKDPRLAEVCRAERRALLKFDLGFGDIRQYPPEPASGRGARPRRGPTTVSYRAVPEIARLPRERGVPRSTQACLFEEEPQA